MNGFAYSCCRFYENPCDLPRFTHLYLHKDS